MQTSPDGIRFIESNEGFCADAYDDGGGTLTVGYGTTSADLDPLPRHVTREEAEQILIRMLRTKYEPAVNALGVGLTQNQFDALVDLCYSEGPGCMQWQIGQHVRMGNFEAAAEEFLRYVTVGGVVWPGLVSRRRADRELFLRAEDPYERFPDAVFSFSRTSLADHPAALPTFTGPTLQLGERSTVREYDRLIKDPQANAARIARHRAWLAVLRDRVWAVAHEQRNAQGKPSWGQAWRGWRWQQLSKRVGGMR